MSIATKNQYWNARMTGADPANPGGNSNDVWAGGSGSASGGDWVITNGQWTITPDATDLSYTILACFSYTTAPSDGAVLLSLDNGTHKVELQSNGTNTGLKIVGASTATFSDLDLNLSDSSSVPIIIRLTLENGGAVKCYRYEIEEDDDANTDCISITGASGSSRGVKWGNTSGNVKWSAVYYSKFGAFTPKELIPSAFAQDTQVRMGLSVVEHIKNSTKPYLKTQVDDSNIVYAYDISPDNIRTMQPPSIHVYLDNISSPSFEALGGSSVEQRYDVRIFVTTKGTNYENAYMLGLNILGEVFDELYTSTGLSGNTDNIEGYSCELDTRTDNDEITCTHELIITYRRRIKMTRR